MEKKKKKQILDDFLAVFTSADLVSISFHRLAWLKKPISNQFYRVLIYELLGRYSAFGLLCLVHHGITEAGCEFPLSRVFGKEEHREGQNSVFSWQLKRNQ